MKILKYSLIATVGIFMLPPPPPDSTIVMQGGTRINLETGEVLGAAAMAYADVSGFCQRQPDVCSTATQFYSSLEARAKYNFQRLYEWTKTSDPAIEIPNLPAIKPKTEKSALLERDWNKYILTGSITTGSIKTPTTIKLSQADNVTSVNTLQIEDLVPEWRGPAPTSTG